MFKCILWLYLQPENSISNKICYLEFYYLMVKRPDPLFSCWLIDFPSWEFFTSIEIANKCFICWWPLDTPIHRVYVRRSSVIHENTWHSHQLQNVWRWRSCYAIFMWFGCDMDSNNFAWGKSALYKHYTTGNTFPR